MNNNSCLVTECSSIYQNQILEECSGIEYSYNGGQQNLNTEHKSNANEALIQIKTRKE